MFKYIEKIQQKPEHVKKSIALFITIGLFFVVIFLWFFLHNLKITPKENIKNDVDIVSPFVNVKNSVEGIFYGMSKETVKIRAMFNIK